MRMVKLASTIALLAVVLLLWSLQGSDDERADRRGGDAPSLEPEEAPAGPEQRPEAEHRRDPVPPLDTASPPNRPAEGPPPLPEDETWEVLVLDARKRPAIGVQLRISRMTGRVGVLERATGEDGRATFPAPDRRYILRFPGRPGRQWVLTEPKTKIQLGELIRARVFVVHAETGRRVSKGTVHPYPLLGDLEHFRYRFLRRGYYEFTVFRGSDYEIELAVSPPEGLAAARFPFKLEGHVSMRADELELVLPVWPEADVRARVLRQDGTLVKLPLLQGCKIGNDRLRARAEASGKPGVMRIRGVPLIPAEEITVAASVEDLIGSAKVRLHRSDLRYETDITLVGLWIGGGAGGSVRGRSGSRRSAREHGAGRVGVGVEDRRGRAARFVHVKLTQQGGGFTRLQRTTMNGGATFLNVPGGKFTLELIEPGYVYTATRVQIGEGGSAQVALREPKGRTARIEVFDQDGYPAAYMRVRLKPEWGPDVVALDRRGVQQGVLYTNRSGVLLVEHVPRLTVAVKARRGSSSALGFLGKDQESITLHLRR